MMNESPSLVHSMLDKYTASLCLYASYQVSSNDLLLYYFIIIIIIINLLLLLLLLFIIFYYYYYYYFLLLLLLLLFILLLLLLLLLLLFIIIYTNIIIIIIIIIITIIWQLNALCMFFCLSVSYFLCKDPIWSSGHASIWELGSSSNGGTVYYICQGIFF